MARDLSSSGRIFLAPQPTALPQFWINVGYDSYHGFKIPDYIPQFEEICTREQYDSLMKDVEEYFQLHSISQSCVMCTMLGFCCPCISYCSNDYFERRRRKFDAGFDAIIRKHASSTKKWKSEYTYLCWAPGSLKWTYGFSTPIVPHKAYDEKGNVLEIYIGKGSRNPVWPPPYYNIVFAIPIDIHKSIRNKWPGEDTESETVPASPSIYSRLSN